MNNVLPHDRQVEEALIGSLLINPDMLNDPDVVMLETEDFYIHANRFVFDACRRAGAHLDYLTAYAELAKMGKLEEVGESYLTTLITNTPSSMHAPQYARTIKDYAVRRRDIEIARQIATASFEGQIDRARFLELLADNQKVEGGSRHVEPSLRELIDQIEARAKDPKAIWGIPTGFADLDTMIGGLQKEQTMMLAAPPGVGKSVLTMQIAHNVAKRGIGVAIYSFEMSAIRVLTRLISADSGVSTRAMHTGRMEGQWQQFYDSASRMSQLPIYISDIYGMTTSAVRADLSKLRTKHSIGLIVVDYLNKLLDRDGGDDISNTKLKAQRMQGICREFGVAGILIQSMNKDGMRATVPVMADMSGPAEAAHEGDNVFLMGNHPEEAGVVQLYPAKLRDGDMGKHPISLRWAQGLPKFSGYLPQGN